MASYIDWYLIELERRLTGRVNPEVTFRVMSEVEDHLRSKAQEYEAIGMATEAVERTAVAGFGRPDEVAFEVVESGHSRAKARLGAWLVLAGAVVVGVIVTLLSCIGRWSAFDANMDFALPVVSGLLFVGTILARKVLATKILIVIAPLALLSGLVAPWTNILVNGNPLPRNGARAARSFSANDLATTNQEIKAVRSGLAYYQSLKLAKGDVKFAVGTAPRDREGKLVAISPLSAGNARYVDEALIITESLDSGLYAPYGYNGGLLARVATPREAMASWISAAPKHLVALTQRVDLQSKAIADIDAALAQRPRFNPLLALLGALFVLAAGGALAVLQALLTVLAYRVRRAEFTMPARVRA